MPRFVLPTAPLFALALIGNLGPAAAGQAEVIGARAKAESGGTYRFSVTLRHADQGWDHYADKWEVMGPGGAVLGVRVLVHPHVDEQPFTRSLRGVRIPPGVRAVTIRAYDSKHGLSDKTFKMELPDR